jgi:hypothetical protein
MRRRVAAASRSACSGVLADASGACDSIAGRVVVLALVASTRRVAFARLDRCVPARSEGDGAGDCAVAALGAVDSVAASAGAEAGGDVASAGAAVTSGTPVEEDDDDVAASAGATDGWGAIAAGAVAGSDAAPVGATGGAAAGAAPLDSEGAAPAGGVGAGGLVACGASPVVVGMDFHCVATAAATTSTLATSHPMRRALRGGG